MREGGAVGCDVVSRRGAKHDSLRLPAAAILGGGEGRVPSLAVVDRVQIRTAYNRGIQSVTKRLPGEDGIGIGHESERRWGSSAWKDGQRKVGILAAPEKKNQMGHE